MPEDNAVPADTESSQCERESRHWAEIAARAADEKKAEDVVVMDVADLLVVTDFFLVCTGRNDRQVRSIAAEVEDRLRLDAGVKPIGREGMDEGRWVLLDFADLVVHVFQPDEREFYRLDRLWGQAPRLSVEGVTSASSREADEREASVPGADKQA